MNSAVPSKQEHINDLVTVVIPCYRQEAYLGEAIESVQGQAGPPVEIIVVDDGSPGDVRSVVERYPGVRLLEQANGGAAAARNHGLRESRGSYLLFLDADDRLVPGALQATLAFLKANKNCAFVWGWVELINREGEPLEIPYQPHITKEHFRHLLQSNVIWTPGVVLYRRSALEGAAFDAATGASADYELNIRLARSHEVGCLPQVVLQYRVHGENMSGDPAFMLRSGLAVRRAQYPFIRHDSRLVGAWKEGMAAVQHDAGERLLQRVGERLRGKRKGPGLGAELACLLRYYPQGLPKAVLRFLGLRKR
jgi:glycosyltransferase involved in cell wall biosynthesis